jgi:hypothetical protein
MRSVDFNPDDLISDAEAAELLRQKTKTLTEWRHLGIGPDYYKIGRRIFYSRAGLAEWIATRRVIPQERKQAAL